MVAEMVIIYVPWIYQFDLEIMRLSAVRLFPDDFLTENKTLSTKWWLMFSHQADRLNIFMTISVRPAAEW